MAQTGQNNVYYAGEMLLVLSPEAAPQGLGGLPLLAGCLGVASALLSALAHMTIRRTAAFEPPELVVFYFALHATLFGLLWSALHFGKGMLVRAGMQHRPPQGQSQKHQPGAQQADFGGGQTAPVCGGKNGGGAHGALLVKWLRWAQSPGRSQPHGPKVATDATRPTIGIHF